MDTSFGALAQGYRDDWARAEYGDPGRVRQRMPDDIERAALGVARRIFASRARYETVQKATGVRWFVIGLLHYREADLDFECHLANGDSLKKRTVNVPAGQLKTHEPPYLWEEAAIFALVYDSLDKVPAWTIEHICHAAEIYNGFGPRYRGKHSGYLWAGLTPYDGGKFVKDRVWDSSVWDTQLGIMTVLKAMLSIDPNLMADTSRGIGPITIKDVKQATPAAKKIDAVAKAGGAALPAAKAAGTASVSWWLIGGGVAILAVVILFVYAYRVAFLARIKDLVADPNPPRRPEGEVRNPVPEEPAPVVTVAPAQATS